LPRARKKEMVLKGIAPKAESSRRARVVFPLQTLPDNITTCFGMEVTF
jgi:hypothetical protein